MNYKIFLCTASALLLSACSDTVHDPRGVEKNETLLSVSASGEADMRPDEARFQAGVQNWAGNAQAASEQTQTEIADIVAALRALEIAEDDIQTSAVNVQRIDYGDRRGQYQASNTLSVRVRNVEQAGAAVTAVTEVGANIVSGPDLRLSDPEAAANAAYGNAYKNAFARAEAYAEAAGMDVSRVLYIRDAGGSQGSYYLRGATQISEAFANNPPPPVAPPPPQSRMVYPEEGISQGTIMPGQTTSAVSVQVDFALTEQ